MRKWLVCSVLKMVRPEGFEPPTLGSEDQCSIQLSYGRARTSAATALRQFGRRTW